MLVVMLIWSHFNCFANCCLAEYHIFTILLIVMLMVKFLTVVLSIVMLSIVFYCNANCCYAAHHTLIVMLSVVMLSITFLLSC